MVCVWVPMARFPGQYEPIEIAVKRCAKQEEENGVDFDGYVLVDAFYH